MNPSVKIVHVCPYDYSLSGGHSNAIRALAEGQANLNADVTVLSCSDNLESLQAGSVGVKVEVYRDENELMNYIKSLGNSDQYIISFCGVRQLDVSCARMCRKLNIKYVFASGGALHYRSFKIWVKKFVYTNFFTRYFRGASGLVATTEFERNRLRHLLPCYQGSTGVVPNIIEPASTSTSCELRENEVFTFGFMGRLDVHTKGLDLLIPAFAKLHQNTTTKLVLVGPDHAGGVDSLKLLINEYGVEGGVEIREPAYGEDKERFFSEIDCMVSLSRWEAFGISFVEAMSRGVASILSDQVNLKLEIIKHNAAELVALNINAVTESMRQMMTDEPYRLKISESGKNWASSAFQQEMVAEDSLEFYENL